MSGINYIISLVDIFSTHQSFYFDEVFYPPGGRLGPRVQHDLQLVIIHSGEVDIAVDDQLYRVGRGEATLLQPGCMEIFHFSKKSRTHHFWCSARLPILSDNILQKLKQIPLVFPWNSSLEKMFRLGLETQRKYDGQRHLVIDHLAHVLFYELFAELGVFPVQERPPHPAVQKALQFIKSNLQQTLSSKAIASASGMSYHHLALLFKEDHGETPSSMLWRLRIRRGAELLCTTGLSVSEIAFQLGFKSPFHFSRCIKKQFKFSPLELRKGFSN